MINIKSKEKQLKRGYDLSKIKTRPDDERKYFIVNRKPISIIYEGLIDKLYDHFFGDNAATMETYFDKGSGYHFNSPKGANSKGSIVYFRNITKGRQLTRKRFNGKRLNFGRIVN